MIRFSLLGGFQADRGEAAFAPLPRGKAGLLLAYLILSPDRPLSRRQIAFDFWPDSTEKQALTNLRKLIHDLRNGWPPVDRYLLVAPAYLQWNHEYPCQSDVSEFERSAQGSRLHELLAAEELYRGELLPGYYEEWLHAKREMLAHRYADVLEKLVAMTEARREYASAALYANKLLLQNASREETYRTLMRLYALKSDTAAVVQTYERLCAALESELGIAPAEATRQLFDKLTRNAGGHAADAYGQPPLIGRIDEWEQLLHAWERAAAGAGSFVVLKGEAGIGKTRLALEFKAWVACQGYQAAFAGCYQSVRSMSYMPATAWLRSLPVPDMNPVWLSELARLLPELLERHPELPAPSPVRQNWQLNRWYEAIERMMLAGQPLLLVLDDVQWSDSETLHLVSYLLRGGSAAKLLVLGTMRTDEEHGDAALQPLSGLRSEHRLTEIELAPFNERDTERLMAAAVGEPLAARHSSELYAETGGNPLFIVETIREWQSGGGEGGFRLSPLVATIVGNRLNRLSAYNRRLVSTMAVVGRPVTAALLAAVSDTGEEPVLERIEQLMQMKVLREAGDGNYDFIHDVLKEAAYRSVSESWRRQCHRKIAGCLIDMHRGQSDAPSGEIALHFERAGMVKEAVACYEQAASAAERMYANETRIDYYRKLCGLLPFERRLPVLLKLGEALIVVGSWKEAEHTYTQWLERPGGAAEIGERARCEMALGNCMRLQGKYEEAVVHLERALRCFELTNDHAGLSSACVALGLLHYYKGNYADVHFYLNKRAERIGAGGRTGEDARIFGIIGHMHYDQCEYGEASHWIRKQIGLASGRGDKYTVEQALGVLSMIHMDSDEMDRAFELIADKLEIAGSIGDRMGFAIACGMLGKYYLCLGRLPEAEACVAFCHGEAVSVKDWRIAGIMLGFAGRILSTNGRGEEAFKLLERSVRLFEGLSTPYFLCESLYYTSVIGQRLHRPERAAAAAAEGLGLADRLKRKDMQFRLRLQLITLQRESGRIALAEAEEKLRRLQGTFPGLQEAAAAAFEIWKLNPASTELRDAALASNAALYRKSGKQEYRDRCRQLGGPQENASAPPLPKLAAEAVASARIAPGMTEDVDRFLDG